MAVNQSYQSLKQGFEAGFTSKQKAISHYDVDDIISIRGITVCGHRAINDLQKH